MQKNKTNAENLRVIKTKDSQLMRRIDLIENCTDYKSIVKVPGFNRDLPSGHPKDLSESFLQFGAERVIITVIRTKALTGKKIKVIVDGQNSYKALKTIFEETGKCIPFILIVLEAVNDTRANLIAYMAALNNTIRFTSAKLVGQFASCPKEEVYEYKVFQKFIEENKKEDDSKKLTATDFKYIYLGGADKKVNKAIMSGNMTFPNESRSKKLLAAIKEIRSLLPDKSFARRALYNLVISHEELTSEKIVSDLKAYIKAKSTNAKKLKSLEKETKLKELLRKEVFSLPLIFNKMAA